MEYDGTTGAFLGTFVSAGSGGLSNPRDLVFGPDGNLYAGSFFSGDVSRYNGSTGAFMDDFIPVGTGGLGGPLSCCSAKEVPLRPQSLPPSACLPVDWQP